MASGTQQPNTRLRLIEASDKVARGDINAIITALEDFVEKIDKRTLGTSLDNNTDLNTINSDLIASLSGDRSYPNAPAGLRYGVLISKYEGMGFGVQIIIGDAGSVFYRLYAAGSWNNWVEPMADIADLARRIKTSNIASGTDLNSIMHDCRGLLIGANTYKNLPSGASWGLFECFGEGTAFVLQRITNSASIYFRMNTGEWQPWKKLPGVTP